MLSGLESLGSRDRLQLAVMHEKYMPDSLVTMFGRAYAQEFYDFVVDSPNDCLLVHEENGNILGACVLSMSPIDLTRRLVVSTRLVLWGWLGIWRMFTRGYSKIAADGAFGPKRNQQNLPEIVYIFVEENARNHGVGAHLLAMCEKFLSSRGCDCVIVNTRDEPSNRAMNFYLRNGFVTIRRYLYGGAPSQTLRKNVFKRTD